MLTSSTPFAWLMRYRLRDPIQPVEAGLGAHLNLITKERRKCLPRILRSDRCNPTGLKRLDEVAINHDLRAYFEQAGNRWREGTFVIRGGRDTVVTHAVLYALSHAAETARQQQPILQDTQGVARVPTFRAFVINYKIGGEFGNNEVRRRRAKRQVEIVWLRWTEVMEVSKVICLVNAAPSTNNGVRNRPGLEFAVNTNVVAVTIGRRSLVDLFAKNANRNNPEEIPGSRPDTRGTNERIPSRWSASTWRRE